MNLVHSKTKNQIMTIFFHFATQLTVFLVYAHTLNYPWKHFDDQIIYNETIFPVPKSFSEVLEYLKHFGLAHHFEASNPFYSSISNIRCDPANTLLTLFVFYFFQKNPFNYHFFSLILHLLNTALLFLLLKKTLEKMSRKTSSEANIFQLFLVSMLTLVWSLHPVNVESILLTTNWGALFSYALCLITLTYFISFNLKRNSIIDFLVIFVIYTISLFNTEYSITLPVILFFYSYADFVFSKTPGDCHVGAKAPPCNDSNSDVSLVKAVSYSFKKIVPLLLVVVIFILFFFTSETKSNIHNENKLIFLQRILWLSPQLLFHNLKLTFFPVNLSIDQSSMVNLSKTYFDFHAVFSSMLMYTTIFLLFVALILIRKRSFFFIFIFICPFLIAMLPFLHLISPIYCLSSERYLYLPTLMLIFGLSHMIFYFAFKERGLSLKNLILGAVVLFILVTYTIKTYTRTFEWKDSFTLFSTSIHSTQNKLFKALRTAMIGSLYLEKNPVQVLWHLNDAQELLRKFIKETKEEKHKYGGRIPLILKSYGLSPDTQLAKATYLLTSIKLALGLNEKSAFEILKPYVEKKKILDTQILDLYLTCAQASGDLTSAKKILKDISKIKISPSIFLALASLENDTNQSLKYLNKSFKYFPYDPQTLFSLKAAYKKLGNTQKYALFSYLYGIRMHDSHSKELGTYTE